MWQQSPKAIRFGPFELDLRRKEIRRRGVPLRVQEQPLCVLMVLIETPGEVISREDLIRKVWPSIPLLISSTVSTQPSIVYGKSWTMRRRNPDTLKQFQGAAIALSAQCVTRRSQNQTGLLIIGKASHQNQLLRFFPLPISVQRQTATISVTASPKKS